jgi:hypothetical protein
MNDQNLNFLLTESDNTILDIYKLHYWDSYSYQKAVNIVKHNFPASP